MFKKESVVMGQFVRLGLLVYCFLIVYGVLSIVQAQPHPALQVLPKTSADKLAYTSYSLEQLRAMKPGSPNPYLSLLPVGKKPDMAYWKARMQAEALARRAAQTREANMPTIEETEPNDSQAAANPIGNFGNVPGQMPATDVSGNFRPPPDPTPIGPFAEDDGAIPLANDAGLSTGQRVSLTAVVGNRPHGWRRSGNGDFDFYMISGVRAGQIITADIDTDPEATQFFDSFLALWDSDGNLLAFNDDDVSSTDFILDSFLQATAPADGTYYVSVSSFDSPVPQDPFDSSSGLGSFSEGTYTLMLGLDAHDVDYFSVALNAGDVLNVTGLGAISHVSLFDPMGVELLTSNADITPILPGSAPFAAGDNPSLVYVIDQPGTYGVRVTGRRAGMYLSELRTARPPLEAAEPGTKQILFIDFDGAIIDISIFGEFGRRLLSPMRAFLGNWGLQPSDENAVIDAMVAVATAHLREEILAYGSNPRFDIEIRNSRDHGDPFGEPNVSRVIVGGSFEESGIDAIGIAESIDVGNFNTMETALVQLDALSAPSDNPNSINAFPLASMANIIDFIGMAVGNVIAHEAGHLFGNFHTEPFNDVANLMDSGGNPANTFGVGDDLTFGTDDDIDVNFGLDIYALSEGLVGIEDTLNVIAFGLSSMPTDLTTTDAPVATTSRRVK